MAQTEVDTGSGSAAGTASETLADSFSALIPGEITAASADWIVGFLVRAATALLMLIVAYFAARLASRWVATAMCSRLDQTLGKFAGKFTFYTIFMVTGLAILQTVGISVTSFAAVLAAAGFAIGLAFQGTLSNVASGVLLLVFRPFKVGDLVSAAGITGRVNEIDLFTTTLDTADNRRLIVPNSSIAGTPIENFTFHPHRRVDVNIGVTYSASLEETRTILTACAESMSDVIVAGEDRGYQVVLSNLGDSSVNWTVRLWTTTDNFFAVREALTAEIKQRLDAGGIDIPFPQMQMHLSEAASAGSRTPIHSAEQILPIPKMSSTSGENRGNRIRPRVRGEHSGT